MAQQIGSQVGAWTKVVETVELEDTGKPKGSKEAA